jgi:hypothetical protein
MLSVNVGGGAAASPVVEHLPSLEQHIEKAPVALAARRFLFADKSGRAYGPEFTRGKFEERQNGETEVMTRDDLRSASGSTGRYTADSSIEWQGGFRHSDAQGNLELGQSYLKYLESSVGDSLGKKLSVVSGERVNLLDKVTKTGRGPGGIRP